MMAPLLSPSSASSQQVPRISQLLPTVKCSSCNNPVPLAELGDHICPKPPPLPTQSKAALNLPKPALTPSAATALLPTRLQNLVSNPRSPSPASSVSSSSPSVAFPQRRDSPRISTNTAASPPRNGPFRGSPSAGSPLENMRARTPSNNSPLAMSPGHDGRGRTFSNISSNSLPRPNPNPRARTPSDQSSRPSMDGRARTHSNNAQPFASTSNYGSPPPMMQPPNQPRFQAPPPASYTPPPMTGPSVVPEVIDTKSGGEAGMAGVGRRGFAAAARAAMFALPPPNQRGDGGGGWDDGRGTPFRQNGSEYLNAQMSGYPGPRAGVGAPSPNAPYSPLVAPYAPQTRTPSPMSIPTSNIPPSIPPLNTSFANLSTSPTSNSSNPSSAGPITPLGNARLPFFEKYKKGQPGMQDNEILYDSNNRNLDNPTPSPSKSSTPPKRSHSATPSITNGLPSSPAAARSASSASSYSARTGRQRSNTTTTTASDTKSSSIPVPMSPSSGSEYGLAYADSDAEDEDKGLLPFPGTIKKSPTSSPRKGSILRTSPQRDASRNHIRFPSMTTDSSGSFPQTAALKPSAQRKRERMSTNSNSVYSDSEDDSVDERALRDSPKSSKGLSLLDRVANSHANARGGADLEVVMETLIEDLSSGKDYEDPEMRPLDKGRTFPTRSNTVPGGSLLPPSTLESKNPPPPTTIVRSRTTPGSGLSAHDHDLHAKVPEKSVKPKKIRVCRKCDKHIDDGRWIAIDGGSGGVLCEACWKNMYLPKCRRCNLPIETAAISSSDGQLKGKYHKQCFSCSTCQKPFPDKTFYVFDGKPFCAYHYHEANDSLCAAALCGQPIEGPCAVSHSGDRYHPEHFTCEHPGYPCKTRLEEYWEVDGRMLCDKHVHAARSTYDGDSDYGDDVGAQDLVMSGRAMKRVTRFIDLGEGGLR